MRRNIIPEPLQGIKYLVVGIQCDHCSWCDTNMQVGDQAEWLNRPCPECGHNLLTQHDYDYNRVFRIMTGIVNTVGLPFMTFVLIRKILQGKNSKPASHREYHIVMNGHDDPKIVEKR